MSPSLWGKLNSADFVPQFVTPGTNGVPAPDSTGEDDFESLFFQNNGRNSFRGPFQVRFDTSLSKMFQFKERYLLKFEADASSIFSTIP